MEIGYRTRNGVEQTNEDLKNPERENGTGFFDSSEISAKASRSRKNAFSLRSRPPQNTAQHFFSANCRGRLCVANRQHTSKLP
jgi:hypothetical protein